MAKQHSNPPPTRAARVTAAIAGVVTVAIMLGTGLMLAPDGVPLRSEVRSVAAPYFSQNWRVFAPDILKTNRSVEFRAQWRDDDNNLVRSGWVSITDIEQRTLAGNLAPSRIEKSSWNPSSTYLKRYNNLEDAQRERARDTFIERHDDGFRPIPDGELIAELGTDDSDVILFLRMDYMFMRYVTLYATAGFDETIERVQWRIVKDRPNDFTHRFDDERQFDVEHVTFGWRHSNAKVEPDVVAEFRAVIERYGGQEAFRRAARDAS